MEADEQTPEVQLAAGGDPRRVVSGGSGADPVSSSSRTWASAYWGCAVAHALGHLTKGRGLRVVSKSAMMPALAMRSYRQGGPRPLVGALLLSAVGDSLMEQQLLMPGMVAYGAAHTCYTILFLRGQARVSRRALAVYAAGGAGLVAWLWPDLGRLRGPVATYAAMLSATAVTASSYNRRAAIGGALFVASDALIAAHLAGHDFRSRSTLVGLTYTLGQYELASGVTAPDSCLSRLTPI